MWSVLCQYQLYPGPLTLRDALVLFFKTREPVEPVSFVHRVCSDAMNKVTSQKTRHVKRLTPMTRMGKATEKSLEEVAKAVLAPVFHRDGVSAQKVRSSEVAWYFDQRIARRSSVPPTTDGKVNDGALRRPRASQLKRSTEKMRFGKANFWLSFSDSLQSARRSATTTL